MGSVRSTRDHALGGMSRFVEYISMNTNHVKGTAKDIAGKVQEHVGNATGDAAEQAKGLGKQVEGKVQKGIGNAEDALKDTDRKSGR